LAIVALLSSIGVGTAFAVHDDGVFELDRNALDDADPGDDWENVDDGDDSADATTGILFDGRGPTIFTGGGSKDDLNTTGWKHKSGSVPDKDELLDAYAARYGDVIYFGADRYDASGAAALGFWFFQQEVGPLAGGSFGPGQHQDGDVLILSDFTIGGGTVTIRVFEWNGPGGDIPGQGSINGVLDPLAGDENTPADCVGPPEVQEPDPFCATVNNENETAPWAFVPKGTPAGTFAPGEFYEGGIDLAAFPELADACFSSFLAETRTSPSVGSQLKDFVSGGFEACQTDVTTTPSDSAGNPTDSIVLGETARDYALVVGTGSSAVPTGTVTFYICAPDELDDAVDLNDDPATCDVGGTLVSTNNVTAEGSPSTGEALSDEFEPDAVGTWCWRGEYSGDDNYPADTDASTGECFEVTDTSSIDTAQTWLPNDSATVTTAGGSAVSGTVTFKLYSNGTCTEPALDTYTDSSAPFVSNNTTHSFTADASVSWLASFDSTDPDVADSVGVCEVSTLTIDNDGP